MAEQPKYISFPLFLISGLPGNLSSIFDYGILRFASTIVCADMSVAYKQVLYAYYRGGLPRSLQHMIDELVENDRFLPDDDFNGFNGDTFDPETGLEEFAAAGVDDPAFADACLEFWQLRQAMDILKISSKDWDQLVRSARLIQATVDKREKESGKDVSVMISLELIFSYYKEKKTAYEIDLLRGYLAIKSILGNKRITGTTKEFILTRMVGARKKDLLSSFLKDKGLKKIYDHYGKRYHMDKLLAELLARGFIKGKLAFQRRIYLSNHYATEELPEAVAELLSKNNNKVKRDKNAAIEKEARAKLSALLKA